MKLLFNGLVHLWDQLSALLLPRILLVLEIAIAEKLAPNFIFFTHVKYADKNYLPSNAGEIFQVFRICDAD